MEYSKKPKITAFGNRKGGPGKTSVTLGCATGLALLGRRVLIVDMDPQADATETLGGVGEFNIFDVLHAGETGTLGQAAVSTNWNNIDVVPGSADLARIDTENLIGAEMRLRAAATDSPELASYDHVLIDLPPAVGRLTLNGLIAADQIVVVTDPAAYSVRGVVSFLESVEKVRAASYLNPDLSFGGIIVNKLTSTAEHAFQVKQLEEAFPQNMLQPYIKQRTAMQDSQSEGKQLTQITTRGASQLVEQFVTHARWIDGSER